MLNPSDRDSRRIRGTSAELDEIARTMRRNMTVAESFLWEALKSRRLFGLKFRAQHAVGRFILDFYCPAHRLVVEVDGPSHLEPGQSGHDAARTEQLAAFGYRVLRFTNEEVLKNRDAVLAEIVRACEMRPG